MEHFTNKELVRPCAIAFWVFAAFLFSLFSGELVPNRRNVLQFTLDIWEYIMKAEAKWKHI